MLGVDRDLGGDAQTAEPDFSTLFERPLMQYGMRGDPPLWEAMRQTLAGHPLPSRFWDVRSTVEQEFERITGHRLLESTEPFFVPEFGIGRGMSDGVVDPAFWVRTVIPVLIDRWAGLRVGMRAE